MKEIKGLSDRIKTKDLSFEVTPKVQGLVGKAFEQKSIIIDCNVDPEGYALTGYQRNNTSDVKFCITFPLLNVKDEVVAVVAIDSERTIENLSQDQEKKLAYRVTEYAALIDKHLKF